VAFLRQACIALLGVAAASCGPEVVPFDQVEPLQELALPNGLTIERGTIATDLNSHLRVVLYVRNLGDETAHFGHGRCFVRLRGYQTAELSEPAIWSDQREDMWFCTDDGTAQYTEPRAIDSLVNTVDPSRFAFWPPPDGAILGAVVRLNGSKLVFPLQSTDLFGG
jgi:hypothetical protein